ncbi:hypothetical protein EUGRSUZ_H02081 [Eucalyptus grandis]|uniref:TIR domain-containing protein n=3 Tax=Eucalyptus grandis TaxID=71139 RepID=A0A059B143_EUCGR|nr:hypothetical protein EUGRSUZ_H02081 [Eucalyptus grandis]KAK3416374.1 hypothetical protein EUGRSUZ_H02081 [Eucalyptus grandis]
MGPYSLSNWLPTTWLKKCLNCFEFVPFIARHVQSDIHMRDRAATRPDTEHSEEAHQTSSPLMAASSDLKGNYDVFLSFRGTDVRNNFLGHLYAALDQKGIYTYIDSEELRKGEQITPALIKAIEDSCIAIIIFSEDYASSPWCLQEVDKIMECKEQRGLMVFPVFYKVEPKEVRTPRGSYREAMVKHENKFGRDSEKEKLLSKILVGKELTVFSVDGGINLMRCRLCCKRVLLVLDDVDDVKQLNALAGGCEWFGKGSRIIITTRDNHLLTVHGIDEDHIYEVKTLWYGEALELFNKHAFLRSEEIVIRRDLVDSALHYADGLPLALEVFGSFLCGRREQEWESALNKLAKSPDKTINNVLKLSYDGLEDYAKEIFLDIACFFKGRSIQYIIEVLNSCDFDTTIGVQVLVEKSLITKRGETVQMHDLIQLMGMDIVKQECHDDPGRRSRLWLCEDVCEVLSGEMGTDAVKAIVLDLPKTEAIYIGPNAFTNMRRLSCQISPWPKEVSQT